MTADFETVATGLGFPEGPVAMADGSVLFVDIKKETLSRARPGGRVEDVAHLPGGPNGLAIGPDGAAYVCNNGGVYTFVERAPGVTVPGPPPQGFRGGSIQRVDLATGKVVRLYDSCGGQKLLAPDDIVFDRHGGFWFTDSGYQDAVSIHKGGVYYATPDGRSIERKAAIPTANGVGLSPDGKTVYVSDTMFGRLWALDLDDQNHVKPGPIPEVMPGRVVATLPAFEVVKGVKAIQWVDSLKVEADGHVCVGTLFAGGITVFGPDGAVEFVQVPGELFVTNLCFAGADMQDVFITASSTGRILRMRWPRKGLKLAFDA